MIVETLPIHFAPLQGYTEAIYRNAHATVFGGVETYYTPFVRLEKETFRSRDIRDIEPGNNTVSHLIPQLIGADTNKAEAILSLFIEKGYKEVDINMGCPAKKVNRKLAGSALLQYPDVVKSILTEVVNAVDVPVTLKIRTGWAPEHRNCEEIAQLAEDCGIQALTIHGRTRACLFNGEAEYDSIRAVKQKVSIPVIANGDITDPLKARAVLDYTGADALMIGRAAQGRPWIFREIQHYLDTGELLPPLPLAEVKSLLCAHVRELHDFYGPAKGYRIARKHVSWYLQEHAPNDQFRRTFNAIEDASEQLEALEAYFENLA